MTTVECIIEPWAEKALRLLRSDEKDSTEQLRLMLEESIRQKYGYKINLKRFDGLSAEKEEAFHKKKKDAKKNTDSDSSSSSEGSDIIAIIDTYSCKICRSSACGSTNQLVDCAECHNHFHQECHNPPITDCDVNDPRVVWYCSSCSKTVAKPKLTSSGNGSSPSSSSSSKSSSKVPSSVRSNVPFSSKPFGGTSSSSRKSSGTSSSTASSAPSTSKGSSSTSSKNIPNMNIIHADKRLQIMKKKAAKKQEKRGISSK